MIEKIFELRLGQILVLKEISEQLSRPLSEVLETTKAKIDEYTVLFGIKPLNLEYRTETGFILRADSQIGYFGLDYFAIRISPKIEGLELSKVLMMAQKTNSGLLNIQSDRIQSTLVSDHEYSGFEIMSISFIDCMEQIVSEGVLFGWDLNEDPVSSNRGQILINEWVSSGKSLPIPRSEIEKNLDIAINRYLLSALHEVLETTKNNEIQVLALELTQSFTGVSLDTETETSDSLISQVVGYPRQDYRRAFVFAKALLEGGHFEESLGDSPMPSFVLNLDVIFEEYCASMLTSILDSDIYEVETQSSYTHDSQPQLPGEICPDIVVRNKINSKCVVLDTKNKSVLFNQGNVQSLPSQDVYQLVFYSQRLEALSAILLYPAIKVEKSFPIQGSEGIEVYQQRIEKFMEDTSTNRFLMFPDSARVTLVPWQVDLSGSLEKTELSMISLGFFIGSVLK